MTPQELKASILQLAIQGKLVKNYESDEVIDVESSFCGDTSDFFDIPENWKWMSIKDVASINTGLSFKKQDQKDLSTGSLRILRGGNIGDDYKYHLYEDDVYVDLEQFKTKYTQLLEGDVITPSVTSMEKICKTAFIDQNFSAVTAGGFVYIIRCSDKTVIEPKYLMYFIASAFNKEQCKPNIHKSGQAFYNLNKSGFIEQPICIPPFAEQKRIVAKIEELLPYVEEYDKLEKRIVELNDKFPDKLRKSILQQAVQGKLTGRQPDDESATELLKHVREEKEKLIEEGKIKKTKVLPPISDDEKLFEIPDTWEWVRLTDVAEVARGKSKHRPRNDSILYNGGKYPLIQTGDVARSKGNIVECTTFYNDVGLKQSRMWDKGTLCMTIAANIADVGILDFDACFPDSVVGINAFAPIESNKYFLYMLMAYKNILDKMATKSAQKNINLDTICSLAYPLPPLAEQKRIVARVEELLTICDKLK